MKWLVVPDRQWPIVLVAFVIGILFFMFRDYTSEMIIVPVNQSMVIVNGDLDTVDRKPVVLEKRANAVILILAKNEHLHDVRQSLIQFEDRFNSRYHYPYVFLNDGLFTDSFKKSVTQLLMERHDLGKLYPTRNVSFGMIPRNHWSYPEWIDQQHAAESRKRLQKLVGPSGGSESYRHMCRFFSGFFYLHPLLEQYEYYWRVEPGVNFFCDVDYDPFVFMKENGKEYGFTLNVPESLATISTLWDTTKNYLKEVYPEFRKHRIKPAESPALKLVMRAQNSTIRDNYIHELLASRSPNEGIAGSLYQSVSWSVCQYYNNFEIGHFDFFRSPLYQSYFQYLDQAGGFFYERWGDAPVHTLAASIFLESSQVHFFNDIGYKHAPYILCPSDEEMASKCYCDVNDANNVEKGSCMALWQEGQSK